MSNAVSGLTMNARGTENVANNVANVQTPGYARRDMTVASQGYTGGVRVTGIDRVVNTALLGEARVANGAQAEAEGRAKFLGQMETLIGLTGEAGSLGSALGNFQAALLSATTRPDDEIGCPMLRIRPPTLRDD